MTTNDVAAIETLGHRSIVLISLGGGQFAEVFKIHGKWLLFEHTTMAIIFSHSSSDVREIIKEIEGWT